VNTILVLILQANSLLKNALTNLFQRSGRDQFKLVTSGAKDFQGLVMDISELDPDFVLFDKTTSLVSKDMIFDILTTCPGLRVIVMDEDSNLLHIYLNKSMLLTTPEDLLAVLSSN
jgi:hypothetical protein